MNMIWIVVGLAVVPLAFVVTEWRERRQSRRRRLRRRSHDGAVARGWWLNNWLFGRRALRIEHRAERREDE